MLPPLLTIVIFLWIIGTIQNYVLEPITTLVQNVAIRFIQDVRTTDDFSSTELAKSNPEIQRDPLRQAPRRNLRPA